MADQFVTPDINSNFVSFETCGDHSHVYFIATDQQIHEITWTSNSWKQSALTGSYGACNAPRPASRAALAGFMIYGDQARVYYIADDHQIHELAWNGISWSQRVLTGSTGPCNAPQPASGSPLIGFVGNSSHSRVYYIADDQQIHELAWLGSTWGQSALTGSNAACHAPQPSAHTPLTGFAIYNNYSRVYYIAADEQIHELSWNGDNWSSRSLTGSGGACLAPQPASDSALASFAIYGKQIRAYYVASDQQIHELAWNGSVWSQRVLTGGNGPCNAPQPASGSPLVSYIGNSSHSRVYYIADDRQIHELAWLGSNWGQRALTGSTGASVAPQPDTHSPLAGYAIDNNYCRVYYVGKWGNIQELAWTGDTWSDTRLSGVCAWMTRDAKELATRKMRDITFPGTHDSFTYDLDLELGPDAKKIVKTIFENYPPLRHYIRRMATAQNMDINQQLEAGIRYFDLRLAFNRAGQIAFTHSLISKTLFSDALNAVTTFLGNYPKEIVIWKVDFEGDDGQAARLRENLTELAAQSPLVQYIQETDKNAGAEVQRFCDASVQSVLDSGRRIIIIDSHLVGSIYDEHTNTVAGVVASIEKATQKPDQNLFEPQCILPISLEVYVLGAFKYLAGLGLVTFSSIGAAMSAVLCVAFPAIAPILAPIFAGTILAAYIYFLNADLPSSIRDVHNDSEYRIFNDYYNFATKAKPGEVASKPMLMINNYPDDNYVEKCIVMSGLGLGESEEAVAEARPTAAA